MLTGRYDLALVLISLFVAVLASYTALDLAGRIARARGAGAWLWIGGGAVAMGIGVWSMHFIGMLAFSLPIPLGYDLSLTLLSLALAVLSSGFALALVGQRQLPTWQLLAGALVMGCGIAGMHYLGMYAMLMQPGTDYGPLSFGLPLVVAGRAGQRLAGAAGDPRDPGHPRHRAAHLRARRLPGGAHSSRSCSHRLRPALGRSARA